MGAAPLVLVLCLGTGCGKKGAPLPRLQRIPAAVSDFAAARIGDDVFVTFALPTANIDGIAPADVARVEVYAITLDTEETRLAKDVPLQEQDPEALRAVSTLIFSERVQRPAAPLPQLPEGAKPLPSLPPDPGIPPASRVVARESISAEARVPATLPKLAAKKPDDTTMAVEALWRPAVFIEEFGPRRYYYAVAISARGRYGPHSSYAPVPLDPTSSPPTGVEVEYDESALVIRWKAAADARGVQPPGEPGVLESRPIMPGVPVTMYDVYEVGKDAPFDSLTLAQGKPPDGALLVLPKGLTDGPINALDHSIGKPTLGVERCFVVRPIDVIGGLHVRGQATPAQCIVLEDKFPPAAPDSLASVAAAGVINLIWDANDEPDLAGYLVLRGEAPGATLTPLMTEPIQGTSWADRTVTPGVTYVYAVVAVDKSGNRSKESNRREETSRQ